MSFHLDGFVFIKLHQPLNHQYGLVMCREESYWDSGLCIIFSRQGAKLKLNWHEYHIARRLFCRLFFFLIKWELLALKDIGKILTKSHMKVFLRRRYHEGKNPTACLNVLLGENSLFIANANSSNVFRFMYKLRSGCVDPKLGTLLFHNKGLSFLCLVFHTDKLHRPSRSLKRAANIYFFYLMKRVTT